VLPEQKNGFGGPTGAFGNVWVVESEELSLAEVAAIVAGAESLLELDYRRDPRTRRERLRFTLAGGAYGRRRGKSGMYVRWLEIWGSDEFNLPYQDGNSDGVSKNQRYRDFAQKVWSDSPEDWPRDRWFAWRKNPECLDPELLQGAADRVRMGIEKAQQKARKISD
jgi:hypothetical protein